jgi:hypothetical protein
MNEYDLYDAFHRFHGAEAMNRLRIVRTLDRLRHWADENSDGWHSYPKPLRAAQKAIALVESRTHVENERQEEVDATEAEVKAALAPIKAFLTREGVPHDRVISQI